MKDKNGVQIKVGDIVKIEGAYFKVDNGLYFVEQDGTNPNYLADDTQVTLSKICKNGKISTGKYTTAFFPLMSFCSDKAKNAAANEWNEKNATIEVVYNVDNSQVVAFFAEEAKNARESAKYYEMRGYDWEHWQKKYIETAEYYENAIKRMTEKAVEGKGMTISEEIPAESETTTKNSTETATEPKEQPTAEETSDTVTADNYFIENMKTGKIELHFEKSAYMDLSEDQKKQIKSNFLFSRYSSAWVSRCKFPNTYRAKEIAKSLGLADGGKSGETLSFKEQQEIKAGKAERRAERMENRSEKALERGKQLQKPINDMHGDIAFFTQPNINTSAGRAFTNRRNKMWSAWESGFNEFKKSEYYKERAEQARQTAQQAKPTDKGFIQRRIDDAEKTIRAQKKNIKEYEDILTRIENGETVTAWNGKPYTIENLQSYIDHHNRILDDAMSKAIYYYECMEEVGGVAFDKSNIKKGCLVVLNRWGKVEVIGTGPKNITYKILTGGAAGFCGKASYAEIKEIVAQ